MVGDEPSCAVHEELDTNPGCKSAIRPPGFGFFSRAAGWDWDPPWCGGIEELGRKSSVGAVGCRAGGVNPSCKSPALQRNIVWDMMAFFS